jgi:hypothetical protein
LLDRTVGGRGEEELVEELPFRGLLVGDGKHCIELEMSGLVRDTKTE